MLALMLLQAGVKVAGSALWSLVLRYRVTAIAALACLLPVGLSGQIVSVGVGVVSTEFGGEPAVDVFVAGPPIMGVRPSAVASWSGEASYITKLSHPLMSDGPAWINADVGATWLPFRDYRPEPFVGLYAAAPLLLPRLALHAGVTTEPWQDWAWAALVRVDVLLWFRR